MTDHLADPKPLSPAPTLSDIASRGPSAGAVIAALSIGAFAIGTTEFAAMALLPNFASDLGVTEARAADAISAYALGVVIGAPLLAVAGAKLAKRTLLIWLMLAFAVFNTISAMAPSFGLFVAARFLSGLPHGAYFGVAALVAAGVVPRHKRATAVARVFLGLTIATTIGVPAASLLSSAIGWRSGFVIVGFLALATAAAVAWKAPRTRAAPDANPLRELGALRNRQVLLTVLTGAVGFGGFFAVYTYIASMVKTTLGGTESQVALVLIAAGLGMTLFNLLMAYFADRNLNRTAFAAFGLGAVVLLCLPTAVSGGLVTMALAVFLMAVLGGVSTVMQTRLMNVAGDAQQLAASLHHAAFNVANALGPFLAARFVAAGHDFPVAGYVGAALSAFGFVLYAVTLWDARRSGYE
ncbi:MFS transporter [Maritimibacter sp. DP1N21-5]|uniref:MFS transporter n=1 Tax=Maritimibacter sp. DP1N21-5 TaxID=2836867 RepID=UPI001C477DFB|nr:MFS transporter [Maritimibacter sp. DP1N21-5]MBV7409283.1 MFS transporter [Maritimibacter sp. DP1N21-5]